MAKTEDQPEHKCKCRCVGGGPGGIYGLGFLGALVYFLPQATSFQTGVIGFFKAVFWPALLVYKALGLLNF
jgi:hypothetical protein